MKEICQAASGKGKDENFNIVKEKKDGWSRKIRRKVDHKRFERVQGGEEARKGIKRLRK